jgi:hypothetical protein
MASISSHCDFGSSSEQLGDLLRIDETDLESSCSTCGSACAALAEVVADEALVVDRSSGEFVGSAIWA